MADIEYLYVIFMDNKNKLNIDIINRHVEYLKKLNNEKRLILCGPYKDYAGGMVVIKAQSFAEADKIAQEDPFIFEGYKTYYIRTLECANMENNFLV